MRSRGYASRILVFLTWFLSFATVHAEAARKVAIPGGWLLDRSAVSVRGGRVALGIHLASDATRARVMQTDGQTTVRTDIVGYCTRLDHSIDGRRLLANYLDRRPGRLHQTSKFYLIDDAGEIRWSSTTQASPRFSASGESIYIVSRDGEGRNELAVFGRDGEPIRVTPPRRPFESLIVIGRGEQMITLVRERVTTSIRRIEPEGEGPPIWTLEIETRELPRNPRLEPLDETTLVLEFRSGFAAITLDGKLSRFRPEALAARDATHDVEYYRALEPYPSPRPETLLLHTSRVTRLFALETGALEETSIRLGQSYFPWLIRDRKLVLLREKDVTVQPLSELGP